MHLTCYQVCIDWSSWLSNTNAKKGQILNFGLDFLRSHNQEVTRQNLNNQIMILDHSSHKCEVWKLESIPTFAKWNLKAWKICVS